MCDVIVGGVLNDATQPVTQESRSEQSPARRIGGPVTRFFSTFLCKADNNYPLNP